jgi:hypothetical protein
MENGKKEFFRLEMGRREGDLGLEVREVGEEVRTIQRNV